MSNISYNGNYKNIRFLELFKIVLILGSLSFSIIATMIIKKSSFGIGSNIFLMPLSSFLLTLLFSKNYHRVTDLPVMLMYAFIFMRLNLLPLLFVNSNYSTEMGALALGYLDEAIILSIYEAFVINLVIYIYYKHKHKVFSEWVIRNNFLFPIIIIVLTFYIVLTFGMLSETRELFKTIIDITNDDFTTVVFSPSHLNVGEIKRIILTLFTLIFNVFRIIIPSLIIMNSSKIRKKFAKDIVFVFLLVIQFFFITSTISYTIYVVLILFLLYIKVNNKNSKFVFYSYGVALILVAGYFTARFFVNTLSFNNYFSNMLNAYFTGLTNVAGSYNIDSSLRLQIFISSIKSIVPFNTTIFGEVGLTINNAFNSYNNVQWQISSTIGNGRYYFGEILSPIYSVILLITSLHSYRKSKFTKNPLYFVAMIFLSLLSSISIFMYNEQIFFSWLFSDIVPLLLISYLYQGKIMDTKGINEDEK